MPAVAFACAILFLPFLLNAQRALPENPPSAPRSTSPAAVRKLPRSIELSLASPAPVELAPLRRFVAQQPHQIGVHRDLPPDLLDSGIWTKAGDAGQVWLLAVRSPGAKGVRLHFTDVALGNGSLYIWNGESASGPYRGSGPLGAGSFWSETILSDTVVVEYQPDGAGPTVPFRIDKLSHAGLIPAVDEIAATRELLACQVDAGCRPEWEASSRSIAMLQYEDKGATYSCTGWLINTRSSSRIPYLITSGHCISTQAVADTVSAFFGYRSAECDGAKPATPVARSLGATLLETRSAADVDFSLLRLPSAPPNAIFLGWSTVKPAAGATITAIGHPGGDFQRLTTAVVNSGSSRLSLTPTLGITEGGSSGSPWMSSPGIVVGIHSNSNSNRLENACQQMGKVRGDGEWFAAIYPYIQTYLEDADGCNFAPSAQGTSIPAGGGSGSFTVNAGSSCGWTAYSNAPWITVTGGANSTGGGPVAFSIAANASLMPRSGAIRVAGQEFTITQAAGVSACTTNEIPIGNPVEGDLGTACISQIRSGRFATRYKFKGTAGQEVALQVTSEAFDTYLALTDSSSVVLAQDDDGFWDSNSRIPKNRGVYRLPYSGEYQVEVSSFKESEAGKFRLAVCPAKPATIGQTISGQLSSASCLSDKGNFYADLYTFQGTAGQLVAITMTSSTIDSYLTLTGPDSSVVDENDDGGGGLNARLPLVSGFLTLPLTGTYTLEASTFGEFQAGSYTLTIAGNIPPQNPPLKFVAVTPCRLADTRPGQGQSGNFGPPVLSGGTTRDVPIPSSVCGIPSTARAYSLNITVVPRGVLQFLTVYPTGQQRPNVSTLNSFDGKVVANAAIVPAGTGGAVTVFVTDATDVIIDINGYFTP